MKNKLIPFILFLGIISCLNPALALAQTTVNTELGNNISNFGQFLSLLFRWGIPITAGVGVIMFIYAGYLYMTSQGDTGKIGEAKEIIIGVIVGIMLLFTVGILMRNVLGTLSGTGTSTTTVASAKAVKGASTNIQKAADALKTSTNPTIKNASTQIQAVVDKLDKGTISEADAAKQVQTIEGIIKQELKKSNDSKVVAVLKSISTSEQVLKGGSILKQLETVKPDQAKELGKQLETLGKEVGSFGSSDFSKDLERIGLQIQAGADLVKLIEEFSTSLEKANTAAGANLPAEPESPAIDDGKLHGVYPDGNTDESTPASDSTSDYEYTKPNFEEPTNTGDTTNNYNDSPANTMNDAITNF